MSLKKIYETEKHSISVYDAPAEAIKISQERNWRDNELVRTDELVRLPDYPVDLTIYREELRDYPQQVDFPNGTRPTI